MTTFELNLSILIGFYMLQLAFSSKSTRAYYWHACKTMPVMSVLGALVGVALCMLGTLYTYAMLVGVACFLVFKVVFYIWFPEMGKMQDEIQNSIMATK
jgi:hypothetical protein